MGSTITVGGDVNINAGVFSGNSSSSTITGNFNLNGGVYNDGTSTLNMIGTNKNLLQNNTFTANFYNINVPGTNISITGSRPGVAGVLNVGGSLSISAFTTMLAGSTVTVTGTLGGSSYLILSGGVSVGTGGTWNVPTAAFGGGSQSLPARTYNGIVVTAIGGGVAGGTFVLGPGTFNFNGGLGIYSSNQGTLDASVSNPTVNVTTITVASVQSAYPTLKAGSGVWNITGPINISTGSFQAQTSSITMTGPTAELTLSSGIFDAGTATISISSSIVMSTGIFTSSAASMTVAGDITLNGGTFNAGGSTITVAGNMSLAGNGASFTFNYATSTFNLSGSGKILTLQSGANVNFYNLNIPGSISTLSGSPSIYGTLTVGGSLSIANSLNLINGSVFNLTGTVSGGGISVQGATLGTGGTLNSPVQFFNATNFVPARVYNGKVSLTASCCGNNNIFLAGTHTYNGGLTITSPSGGSEGLDASVNNPTVIVTTVTTAGSSGIDVIKMGSGLWTVSNDWNVMGATVTQSAGGILRLNGTSAQHVYSTSSTYSDIDITNTSAGGVQFQDSLTVSTFTALQPGTTIEFQTSPSSLTVTSDLNIGAAGATTGLRSTSSGTAWLLDLQVGATEQILNTNVQDSNASSGLVIYATSNTDVNNGNNTWWVFVSTLAGVTKYWVASAPSNWSNAANWSATSGGAGGARELQDQTTRRSLTVTA